MRGNKCNEWEEGERKRREEGRESIRTIGGGKENREKRPTVPGEQGGRVVYWSYVRKRTSESETERERELVHISWDRIL